MAIIDMLMVYKNACLQNPASATNLQFNEVVSRKFLSDIFLSDVWADIYAKPPCE